MSRGLIFDPRGVYLTRDRSDKDYYLFSLNKVVQRFSITLLTSTMINIE